MTPVVRLAAVLATVATLASGGAARAEDFPSKPIRLVVPFTPAGATDILARIVAQHLTQAWSQQVVVDNRPGAAGNIGTEIVAKSPADGYTLLMATISTHGINPSLYKKIGYDAVKDFQPVSLVAMVPNVLEVNPGVEAKSVQELIALAKANPGKLNFASSGSGTSIHMSGELFKLMTGVDIIHVPYKGSAPALTDLLGGQVQMMFDNLPASISHIRAGKLRPLAVTSDHRSAALPDVPTMAEAGLPGYEATAWFGLLAPAGTPRPIVDKMSAEIAKGIKTKEGQAQIAEQGAEPVGSTPEEFGTLIKGELEKWAKVVKASGAQVD
jgi:tripartite-type tricarboxylate transporter receptor subunit TctC